MFSSFSIKKALLIQSAFLQLSVCKAFVCLYFHLFFYFQISSQFQLAVFQECLVIFFNNHTVYAWCVSVFHGIFLAVGICVVDIKRISLFITLHIFDEAYMTSQSMVCLRHIDGYGLFRYR